jgi:hypothetical protein
MSVQTCKRRKIDDLQKLASVVGSFDSDLLPLTKYFTKDVPTEQDDVELDLADVMHMPFFIEIMEYIGSGHAIQSMCGKVEGSMFCRLRLPSSYRQIIRI